MNEPPVIMLHNGGIRSLVAAASHFSALKPQRVVFVHLRDEGASGGVRYGHVQRQAEHFSGSGVVSVDLTRVSEARRVTVPTGSLRGGGAGGLSGLARWQMVLAAMAVARQQQGERVVWPAQVDGDFRRVAVVTEQLVLLSHVIKLEGIEGIKVEMPLLELTDRQVIELGGQLGVDWGLAWSCSGPGPEACKACAGCRRRKRAFDSAGMAHTGGTAALGYGVSAAGRGDRPARRGMVG